MARPREFKEDQAIADAMDVFWEHGYEAASISMLLAGMRMTKGSLYKAFQDKKNLFLTAMTLYEQQQVAPAIAILNDTASGDGMSRIARVFGSVAADVRAGDRRGCLLCTTAAGAAASDDEIAQIVDDLLSQLRDGFDAALDQSLPAEQRKPLTSLLVSQYIGLRTLARAQVAVGELDRSVASLMNLLRSR